MSDNIKVKTIRICKTIQVRQFEPLVIEAEAEVLGDGDYIKCLEELSEGLEKALWKSRIAMNNVDAQVPEGTKQSLIK